MSYCSNRYNLTITPEFDLCEHLKDAKIAPYVLCEDDCFGPVLRYGLCDKCWAEHQAETTRCEGCGAMCKTSELRTWKWYDFYAPQGDEPYRWCVHCWDAPANVARRERDRLDREAEYDY